MRPADDWPDRHADRNCSQYGHQQRLGEIEKRTECDEEDADGRSLRSNAPELGRVPLQQRLRGGALGRWRRWPPEGYLGIDVHAGSSQPNSSAATVFPPDNRACRFWFLARARPCGAAI